MTSAWSAPDNGQDNMYAESVWSAPDNGTDNTWMWERDAQEYKDDHIDSSCDCESEEVCSVCADSSEMEDIEDMDEMD